MGVGSACVTEKGARKIWNESLSSSPERYSTGRFVLLYVLRSKGLPAKNSSLHGT